MTRAIKEAEVGVFDSSLTELLLRTLGKFKNTNLATDAPAVVQHFQRITKEESAQRQIVLATRSFCGRDCVRVSELHRAILNAQRVKQAAA